jgi:hypothetical protein
MGMFEHFESIGTTEITPETAILRAHALDEKIAVDPQFASSVTEWLVGCLQEQGHQVEIDETTGELLVRRSNGHLEPHQDWVARNLPHAVRALISDLVLKGQMETN